MKKCWLFLIIVALALTGCGAVPTMETVADADAQPVSAMMRQVLLELPEGTAAAVMESADGAKMYQCQGFDAIVYTAPGGDLDRTLSACTGYTREQLTVMETGGSQLRRYDCVWSAAGEGADQVGRTAILDDGSYHYTVTVMAPAEQAGALTQTWNSMLASFRLAEENLDLNTGS